MSPRLHGTIAAASTPLREGGARLDEDAFGPYADFLVGAGLDGVLAFGTNGEAVLLSVDERRRGLELWLEAVAGRALVAAHCGAQTTADTVALAAHAAESGADAVAVIGPPYFKLDAAAQRAHLLAAAHGRARRSPSTSTSSPRRPATHSIRRCWRASARRRTTSPG